MYWKPKRKRPIDHETKRFLIISVHFKIDVSDLLETCERVVALLLQNYDATARTFHDAN